MHLFLHFKLWASDTYFLYFVKHFKLYGLNMLAKIQVWLSSLLLFNPPRGLVKWLSRLLLNVSDLIFLCNAHVNRQVLDVDYNICMIKISNHCALFGSSPPWMYKSESEWWALVAMIPDMGRTSVAKIYLGVQHLIKWGDGERKNKTAMGVKIKKEFYKFAHAPGNSSSSKHKKDALAYKHMACWFNLEALNLQKLSKYSGSFIKHSAFSRKANPRLDSVQRQVLRLYQRHKM